MTIPDTVTTQITVQACSKIKNKDGSFGYKLECDVPLLHGPKKFPNIIWGCPEQDAPQPGDVLTAVLTRGKLSEGCDGSAYWHYAWRWGGRAPDAAPKTPEAPAAARARPASPSEGRDASIEQQVASKNRTELAIACLQQAVVYYGPGATRPLWDAVVQAANVAYDVFRDVAEVVRWQQPAMEDEAPDETMGF